MSNLFSTPDLVAEFQQASMDFFTTGQASGTQYRQQTPASNITQREFQPPPPYNYPGGLQHRLNPTYQSTSTASEWQQQRLYQNQLPFQTQQQCHSDTFMPSLPYPPSYQPNQHFTQNMQSQSPSPVLSPRQQSPLVSPAHHQTSPLSPRQRNFQHNQNYTSLNGNTQQQNQPQSNQAFLLHQQSTPHNGEYSQRKDQSLGHMHSAPLGHGQFALGDKQNVHAAFPQNATHGENKSSYGMNYAKNVSDNSNLHRIHQQSTSMPFPTSLSHHPVTTMSAVSAPQNRYIQNDSTLYTSQQRHQILNKPSKNLSYPANMSSMSRNPPVTESHLANAILMQNQLFQPYGSSTSGHADNVNRNSRVPHNTPSHNPIRETVVHPEKHNIPGSALRSSTIMDRSSNNAGNVTAVPGASPYSAFSAVTPGSQMSRETRGGRSRAPASRGRSKGGGRGRGTATWLDPNETLNPVQWYKCPEPALAPSFQSDIEAMQAHVSSYDVESRISEIILAQLVASDKNRTPVVSKSAEHPTPSQHQHNKNQTSHLQSSSHPSQAQNNSSSSYRQSNNLSSLSQSGQPLHGQSNSSSSYQQSNNLSSHSQSGQPLHSQSNSSSSYQQSNNLSSHSQSGQPLHGQSNSSSSYQQSNNLSSHSQSGQPSHSQNKRNLREEALAAIQVKQEMVENMSQSKSVDKAVSDNVSHGQSMVMSDRLTTKGVSHNQHVSMSGKPETVSGPTSSGRQCESGSSVTSTNMVSLARPRHSSVDNSMSNVNVATQNQQTQPALSSKSTPVSISSVAPRRHSQGIPSGTASNNYNGQNTPSSAESFVNPLNLSQPRSLPNHNSNVKTDASVRGSQMSGIHAAPTPLPLASDRQCSQGSVAGRRQVASNEKKVSGLSAREKVFDLWKAGQVVGRAPARGRGRGRAGSTGVPVIKKEPVKTINVDSAHNASTVSNHSINSNKDSESEGNQATVKQREVEGKRNETLNVRKDLCYVMFHGHKVICLKSQVEALLILCQFQFECFPDKGMGSINNCIDRALRIRKKALDHPERDRIASFLKRNGYPMANIVQTINLDDARRVYHYMYGITNCSTATCVVELPHHFVDLDLVMPKKRTLTRDIIMRVKKEKKSADDKNYGRLTTNKDLMTSVTSASSALRPGEKVINKMSATNPREVKTSTVASAAPIGSSGSPASDHTLPYGEDPNENDSNDLFIVESSEDPYIIRWDGEAPKTGGLCNTIVGQLRSYRHNNENYLVIDDLCKIFGTTEFYEGVDKENVILYSCCQGIASFLNGISVEFPPLSSLQQSLVKEKDIGVHVTDNNYVPVEDGHIRDPGTGGQHKRPLCKQELQDDDYTPGKQARVEELSDFDDGRNMSTEKTVSLPGNEVENSNELGRNLELEGKRLNANVSEREETTITNTETACDRAKSETSNVTESWSMNKSVADLPITSSQNGSGQTDDICNTSTSDARIIIIPGEDIRVNHESNTGVTCAGTPCKTPAVTTTDPNISCGDIVTKCALQQDISGSTHLRPHSISSPESITSVASQEAEPSPPVLSDHDSQTGPLTTTCDPKLAGNLLHVTSSSKESCSQFHSRNSMVTSAQAGEKVIDLAPVVEIVDLDKEESREKEVGGQDQVGRDTLAAASGLPSCQERLPAVSISTTGTESTRQTASETLAAGRVKTSNVAHAEMTSNVAHGVMTSNVAHGVMTSNVAHGVMTSNVAVPESPVAGSSDSDVGSSASMQKKSDFSLDSVSELRRNQEDHSSLSGEVIDMTVPETHHSKIDDNSDLILVDGFRVKVVTKTETEDNSYLLHHPLAESSSSVKEVSCTSPQPVRRSSSTASFGSSSGPAHTGSCSLLLSTPTQHPKHRRSVDDVEVMSLSSINPFVVPQASSDSSRKSLLHANAKLCQQNTALIGIVHILRKELAAAKSGKEKAEKVSRYYEGVIHDITSSFKNGDEEVPIVIDDDDCKYLSPFQIHTVDSKIIGRDSTIIINY